MAKSTKPPESQAESLRRIARALDALLENTRRFAAALPADNALLCGARSGRVAWQFIQDLAGEMGKKF